VNIGDLNEQVECYGIATVSDGAGGYRASEELLFTDWAKVKRDISSRYANDNQQRTVNRYIVTMRSRLNWSTSVEGEDFPAVKFIKYRGRELTVEGDALELDDNFVEFGAVQR